MTTKTGSISLGSDGCRSTDKPHIQIRLFYDKVPPADVIKDAVLEKFKELGGGHLGEWRIRIGNGRWRVGVYPPPRKDQ